MLARGAVNAHNEYLFDPGTSARAAVFWIRLLENKWTTDFWPGGYGPSARAATERRQAAHARPDVRSRNCQLQQRLHRGEGARRPLRRGAGPRISPSSPGAGQRRRIISSACGRTRSLLQGASRAGGASALIVCNFSGASRTTSAGPEPARTTSKNRHARKERAVRPWCVLTVAGVSSLPREITFQTSDERLFCVPLLKIIATSQKAG